MEDIGMTMMQIAETCNVRYNEVQQIVKKEKIIGTLRKENNRKYFDKYQQELIYQVLYFSGKANELVFESKLNTMEL